MARPTVYATTPTHLFTETLATQRLVTVADNMGGVSKSYVASLSGVACRAQPLSSSEVVRYGRDNTRKLWRFFTAGGLDIVESDRVVFGGENWDIIELADNQDAGVVLRIVAEETNV